MVSNCTVQTNFVEQYRGGLFENTGFIFFFHRAAIRFGKPDDIQLVLEGTEEEQTDYVRGLLASSITIFAIFVFWMLLVLAFKCLGPYAAGILSGRRVPLPPKPQIQDFADDQVYQSQLETWTKNYDGTARGDKFMKGILVFAGLSIVTSSILLSVKGVTSLIKSLDDALATIEVVKVLVNDGIDLINKILASEDTTEEFVVDVLTSMNSMCLDLRDPFCTNITDIDTCNFEGVADENLLKDFFISWENLRQLKYEDLVKSKGDLEDIYDELVELNNTGDTFNWAFWCSMAFSLCLALLCLIMLAGAFFKLSRVTKILRKCILVPSFILMVILSWVFSMVFVIGSVGLADMCYDSPDTFISGLFTKYKDGFSPLIFRSVLFYVNGKCFKIFLFIIIGCEWCFCILYSILNPLIDASPRKIYLCIN